MRITAEFQSDGCLVLADGTMPLLTLPAVMAHSLYELLHDRYKSACPCQHGWQWSNLSGRWCEESVS